MSGGRFGRCARLVPAVLVLGLALGACDEQSRVDPDAAVRIAGTVQDTDGTPLEDRPVRLGSGVSVGEGGLGFLTLGLSCVGGGCAGEVFDSSTDADGSFRFELTGRDTQSGFGEAASFLLSTSAGPGNRATGPSVSARFRVQTDAVSLPPLALADVRPEVAATGDGSVQATWDGSATPGPYTLAWVGLGGETVWETSIAEPAATLDARVLEDVTGVATVSTTRSDAIEGSDVRIVTVSSGVAFRGGHGPPPSRGARCEIRGVDGAVQELATCAVTDGDLVSAGPPATSCAPVDAESPATTCEPTNRVRLHFADPLSAHLVVVRGCADACTVAAVGADGVASDVGAVTSRFGALALDGRPLHGLDVVTSDVTTLAEVSVWPEVTGERALAPVPDGLDLGSAPSAERSPAKRFATIAAVALLAIAALLGGIVLGRRR